MHRLVRVRLTKTRQERNTDSTTISHAQAQEQNTVDRSLSSVDLNPLDLGLLLLRLGHDHGEHPVLHARLDPLPLRVPRQPEPPRELAPEALHPVPLLLALALALPLLALPALGLFVLRHLPLSADDQVPVAVDLHLHLVLLQPREVDDEHVGLRGLLPVGRRVEHRALVDHRQEGVQDLVPHELRDHRHRR